MFNHHAWTKNACFVPIPFFVLTKSHYFLFGVIVTCLWGRNISLRNEVTGNITERHMFREIILFFVQWRTKIQKYCCGRFMVFRSNIRRVPGSIKLWRVWVIGTILRVPSFRRSCLVNQWGEHGKLATLEFETPNRNQTKDSQKRKTYGKLRICSGFSNKRSNNSRHIELRIWFYK